jgi:hypothetical protein
VPDACTILSQSVASQLTGSNVSKISSQSSGSVSLCLYADTSTGATAEMLIESYPGVASSTVLSGAIAQAGRNGSSGTQPVSGLGDSALKEVESNAAVVAFAKGGTIVLVEAVSPGRTGASIEPDLEGICHQVAGQV